MVNENLTINFLGVYLRPNYNIKMFSIGFGIEISLINIYKGNYYYLMVNNNTNNNYSESSDYQKGSIYDLNGIVSNVGNQINFTPSLSYNISIKDKIGFKPFVEFLFPVKPFLKENSNLRFLSFNNHVGNFFFSFRAGFITEFCLKNRQKNKN